MPLFWENPLASGQMRRVGTLHLDCTQSESEVTLIMPGIVIRDGDSFEAAIKKFKKTCEKAGILSEIRKREAYEKPSVKRKKKAVAARKRSTKKARGPRF